ncbi:unnamed protein product [Blepharisma stoltei]|uniref:PARP-type domain-containing protein n=1 Tax=Blepharisma stoltei TaxID=1481888 RepID=A0AAU9JRD7_9CILI|nr:unnamed protein product [Blepharisma stoltei]
MFRIEFEAQYCKSSLTRCRVCQQNIKKHDIRIFIYHMSGNEYYHLNCYRPKVMQYICEKDIRMNLGGDGLQRFKEWLEEWNSKYPPIDKPYHSPPNMLKQVESKPSKYKRAWIEVFRFMSPAEVASKLSFVCKEFYHITWDEELWHFYYTNEFPVPEIEVDNWKNSYIAMALKACIGCHKLMEEDNFFRCPLLKKPLCMNCSNTKKFRVLSKSQIKAHYQINPNLLNVQFYLGKWSTLSCYNFMIKKAVVEYRQQNKQILLKELENKPQYQDLKEILDSIKLGKLHKNDPPDANLMANPFYPCYEKLAKYLKNKEGGAKWIHGYLKNNS